MYNAYAYVCICVMSTCGKCLSQVSRNTKNKIQCCICKSYFHGPCVNLTVTDIEVISSGNKWCCESCNRKKRLNRSSSDSCPVANSPSKSSTSNEMAISMDVLKSVLNEMKKEIMDGQGHVEKELGKALENCSERIRENNELILRQQEIINKQQEKINSLEVENKQLKAEVKSLTRRQTDLEQYSRRNTLEIFGIPESDNESNLSLKRTVIDIGAALGVELKEDGIDACHRFNGGNNRPTSGIIVKFVRRDDPDQLLAKRKVKSNFSTRHLQGHSTDSPIYINPSLAPARRVLLAKARKLRTEFNYKFVWVDRAGRIKVRKSDDRSAKVIVLNDDDDLQALLHRETASKVAADKT
jgi:hypothetical protein